MKLEVWLDQTHVGDLAYQGETNRFDFAYRPDWRTRSDAYVLAPTLPLTWPDDFSPDQRSAATRQFFENLLPEGQALGDAAAAYQISRSNLAGLLAVLGRETAGALRLRVANSPAETELRRPLTRAELSARIRQRPALPFTVWDGKVRLSIAGFQDKLAVLADGDDWFLVEGEHLASTHILKPEPANPALAGLTSNEFFCMKLARAVGLPVADVALHHVPEPVLAITRFDRSRDARRVHRHHLIDGCQLLGLPPGFKYERPYGDHPDVRDIRDGASLPRLFAALDASPAPAVQRLRLLRWVVFQVLIGNTDAHAKNLSFFVGANGPELAPAYDLLCSRVFDATALDSHYALAIGDAFDAESLSPYEWAVFCDACRVNPALLEKELARLAQAVSAQLPALATSAVAAGASPEVAGKLESAIHAECQRQQAMAPRIRGMMDTARGS